MSAIPYVPISNLQLPNVIEARYEACERNDPDEAEFIIGMLIAEFGYAPSAMVHYLCMLQDDDADLRRRITGLDIRPEPHVDEVA